MHTICFALCCRTIWSKPDLWSLPLCNAIDYSPIKRISLNVFKIGKLLDLFIRVPVIIVHVMYSERAKLSSLSQRNQITCV